MKDAENITEGTIPPEIAKSLTGIEIVEGMLSGRFPQPPFISVTGIKLISASVGKACFQGLPSRSFYNPMSVVHGGWLALLLDTAMGCAVQTTMKAGEICSTIDMTCGFVKPAREGMGVLTCEGIVLHRGGRVVSAEAKLTDAKGTLIAYGTESCMVSSL